MKKGTMYKIISVAVLAASCIAANAFYLSSWYAGFRSCPIVVKIMDMINRVSLSSAFVTIDIFQIVQVGKKLDKNEEAGEGFKRFVKIASWILGGSIMFFVALYCKEKSEEEGSRIEKEIQEFLINNNSGTVIITDSCGEEIEIQMDMSLHILEIGQIDAPLIKIVADFPRYIYSYFDGTGGCYKKIVVKIESNEAGATESDMPKDEKITPSMAGAVSGNEEREIKVGIMDLLICAGDKKLYYS